MHEIDKDFDQDGAQIIQQRASAADAGPQETPCAGQAGLATYDLTASQFISGIKVKEQETAKEDKGSETKEVVKLNMAANVDSFEDLEGEYQNLKLEEERREKEDRAKEAEVKVFMNHQIVFDDYISSGAASHQGSGTNQTTKPTNVGKTASNSILDDNGEVDWFRLYAAKDFDFRKNKDKLALVRTSISIQRQISPQGQVYDALANDAGNTKHLKASKGGKKNYINQAMEEAMMSSQVILGNTQKEESLMQR